MARLRYRKTWSRTTTRRVPPGHCQSLVRKPVHLHPVPGLQGGVMAPCAQAAALSGGEVDVQGRMGYRG